MHQGFDQVFYCCDVIHPVSLDNVFEKHGIYIPLQYVSFYIGINVLNFRKATVLQIFFTAFLRVAAVFEPNVVGFSENRPWYFKNSWKLNGNISVVKERPRRLVAISVLNNFEEEPVINI